MSLAEAFNLVFPGLTYVVSLAIVLGPIVYFNWRSAKRRRDLIAESRAKGTIGPARFLQGASLPRHYDALAHVGTAGPAPLSLSERVLRPGVGVRLLVLGLVAALGTFVLSPDLGPVGFHEVMAELPVPPVVVRILLLLVLGSALVHIFGFHARYDHQVLIVTRMVFSRREYRWKDLRWIGDDGAYDLVLDFGLAGKAKVLKHCPGIDDFKAFATAQLRQHKDPNARTARG